MREDWKAATEYIKDLETINDLQSAEIEELRSMLAAAKAQIADLLRDRRAPDLRAIG
jgi:hypothetical protein